MGVHGWVEITQLLANVAVLVGVIVAVGQLVQQTRQLRFRNYLSAVSGSADLARQMVERPELHDIYAYSGDDIDGDYRALSTEQRARVHYCDALLSLCETVWYAGSDGWLPEDEWEYWRAWLKQLNGCPEFRWALKWTEGDYDHDFIKSLDLAQPGRDLPRRA